MTEATPVEVRTDHDSYQPGQRVTGTVVVVANVDARALTLTLECREWSNDFRHVAATGASLDLAKGQLELGDRFQFDCALPDDALPSVSGVQGHLSWGLHAHVDRRGRDRHVWLPIEVTRAACELGEEARRDGDVVD